MVGQIVEQPMPRSVPANDVTSVNNESFDDMPPLLPLEFERVNIETEHRAHQIIPQNAIAIESPADMQEGMELWAELIENPMDEAVRSTMRSYWRGLVHANRYLAEQLATHRRRLEATRRDLAWTRRELATALERERETINATYQTLIERTANLQVARVLVNHRETTRDTNLVDGMGIAEWDYIDDPSTETANREMSAVLDDEMAPPAYQPREPALRAMTVIRAPPTAPANMKTRARIGRCPLIPRIEDTRLTMFMMINGLEAIVLFDSGSTSDSISPEFAKVSNCRTFELENPTQLQLGCSGSKSTISHGTQVPVRIGETAVDVYLDVVNLDRYDVVFGTPFMRRLGVILNFDDSSIVIQGQSFKALTPLEEDVGATRRKHVNGSSRGKENRAPAIRSMRTRAEEPE